MVINESVLIVLFFAVVANLITTIVCAIAVVTVSASYIRGLRNERERERERWVK